MRINKFTWIFVVFLPFFGMECAEFIVFSPPKCGTHLVGKALEMLVQKKGDYQLCDLKPRKEMVEYVKERSKERQFVIAHNWSKKTLESLDKKKYKIIFVIRDPRDHLLSVQGWLREGQWGWLPVSKIENQQAQLEELITGKQFGWCSIDCITSRYELLKKIKSSHIYIVHFEDLVGEKGGGQKQRQLNELQRIALFLEVPLSLEKAEEIAGNLFGGTKTFRKGTVGRWKEELTSKQQKLFYKFHKKKLKTLNYGK